VPRPAIPALEVGGSHVSAALVDSDAGTVVGETHRLDLDGAASAADIVDALVLAARAVSAPPAATWGVAMPGPFDYARGVGRFDGVGKFDSLRDVDLRATLSARLPGQPRGILFVNDADAFILGEWAHGAAAGHRRCVGLTLGTGIGTGWVLDGRIVGSGQGIPPDGRANNLEIDGAPLEQTVSSRAIRRAYQAGTGDAAADVRTIAERARRGDPVARGVLADAMRALGAALGPCLRGFGADVVVVGGSMARSWDLFESSLRSGLAAAEPPLIRLAENPEHAALLGAARCARNATG
jgi:glucokinase